MSPAKRPRILVIDNHESIHGLFRRILGISEAGASPDRPEEATLFGDAGAPAAAKGFEMDSAYQGEQGLELVREARQAGRPYALAFVDRRLSPGWDGIETTARLWEVDPELRVVICTASPIYSWDEITERLGPAERWQILKKPFHNVEIQRLVGDLTKNRHGS